MRCSQNLRKICQKTFLEFKVIDEGHPCWKKLKSSWPLLVIILINNMSVPIFHRFLLDEPIAAKKVFLGGVVLVWWKPFHPAAPNFIRKLFFGAAQSEKFCDLSLHLFDKLKAVTNRETDGPTAVVVFNPLPQFCSSPPSFVAINDFCKDNTITVYLIYLRFQIKKKWPNLWLPLNVQKPKVLQLQEGFAWLPDQKLCPGPCWGAAPRLPL